MPTDQVRATKAPDGFVQVWLGKSVLFHAGPETTEHVRKALEALTGPPPAVWLVTYTHKHGQDHGLYSTCDNAWKGATKIVLENLRECSKPSVQRQIVRYALKGDYVMAVGAYHDDQMTQAETGCSDPEEIAVLSFEADEFLSGWDRALETARAVLPPKKGAKK